VTLEILTTKIFGDTRNIDNKDPLVTVVRREGSRLLCVVAVSFFIACVSRVFYVKIVISGAVFWIEHAAILHGVLQQEIGRSQLSFYFIGNFYSIKIWQTPRWSIKNMSVMVLTICKAVLDSDLSLHDQLSGCSCLTTDNSDYLRSRHDGFHTE
jgi:hypothetical protein